MSEDIFSVRTEGNVSGVAGTNTGTVNITYISQTKTEGEIQSLKFNKDSPYLSLNKFLEEDQDKFFGRKDWTDELTKYLQEKNVLLLLGASGSGKSSLIRAGVIPKLRQYWGSFINLTFEPDVNPFESLYICLANQPKYRQSEAEIAKTGEKDTLINVVSNLKQDARWLIFIDQFEELFIRTPKSVCDKFVPSLVQLIELIKEQDSTLKIVLTMRADFLDKLSPYPRLGILHDRYSVMLTDMSDNELKLAIAEPAATHGVTFENGLVQQIIDDFHQQEGSLPLLQYTLDLLWKNDDIEDRVLNTETYNTLGGVTGALNKQANNIYDKKLKEQEQKAAKQIFLELVQIEDGKPVSRRVNKSNFEDNTVKNNTVEKLIKERLLVSKQEKEQKQATVEIAHEKLLTSWEKLKNWIEEEKEAISLKNFLADETMRWQIIREKNKYKANDELLKGSRLEEIIQFRENNLFNNIGGLNKQEDEFINASIKWKEDFKKVLTYGKKTREEIDKIETETITRIQRENQSVYAALARILIGVFTGTGVGFFLWQNIVEFSCQFRENYHYNEQTNSCERHYNLDQYPFTDQDTWRNDLEEFLKKEDKKKYELPEDF